MRPPKAGGGSYTCTFSDEFDGRELDRSTWVVQDTSKTGFHIGGACFKDDPSHLRVRNGELTLRVSQARLPFTCHSPHGSFQTRYQGADISTWGGFSQTYGRFETRIKFSSTTTPGVHGGFWANPQKKVYGAWPHSGEIDIAEWFSNRPHQAFPSLHYAGRTYDDTGWACYIGRADEYHTYAVEWDAREMRFIYDDRVCYTRSWTPAAPLSAPAPFDQAFYLSLSQGIGPQEFNAPAPETRFPADMTVDYVRAWS